MTQIDPRQLGELPSLVGLFGSMADVSPDSTMFDVIIAIATAGGH